MFKAITFRSKLLLAVMPVLFLGLLALGFGAHWYIDRLIKEELTSSMLATTAKTAESINNWFRMLMLEPESFAATDAAQAINENFEEVDRHNIQRHAFLHKKYPSVFQDVYAANRKGEYHTVQEAGNGYRMFRGDISTREYFKSIMAGGPSQITPPLASRTTGVHTVFVVAPIQDASGQPLGLSGAGISLDYISMLCESLKAGKTGYGIILAQDGTFISHQDDPLPDSDHPRGPGGGRSDHPAHGPAPYAPPARPGHSSPRDRIREHGCRLPGPELQG
ncbi:cache domain-containing protein [Holophaga foetida]|uniref:cache domain-containing protein n=1 Tax=Holophaga foetida TaxID=35839 RepID=UPI0002E6E7D7|nr:cache domain-containing protein [Holophaga foetida]